MNALSLPVANAAALVAAGYTTIEVWSSAPLPAPVAFSEVTSATALAAVLTSSAAQTQFQLGGTSFSFSINGGAAQTVSFDSVLLYWTPAQVVTEINSVVAGLASLDPTETMVVLTSPTTGRASSLQILATTASALGWLPGQSASGTDARLTLVGSQIIYPYNDLGGVNGALYKWRFSVNGANPISDFQPPGFPIEGYPPAVSTVNTTLAIAQFIDLAGRPKKAKIIIALDENPSQFGSSTPPLPSAVAGQGPQSQVFCSDDMGLLQVQLIQGLQIRVAIEGTAYVRQITVPTGVTSFDLLAAMAAAPDQFTIQTPLPYLIRQHV
jgi:hypothetical protein